MKRRGSLAALFFLIFPALVLAARGEVPAFYSFVPESVRAVDPGLVPIEIAMRPVASVRVPGGLAGVGSFSYGMQGYDERLNGSFVVLQYETEESIVPYKKDPTPAASMQSTLEDLDGIGCQCTVGQGHADEDCRPYSQHGKSGELFAYGRAGDHQRHGIGGTQTRLHGARGARKDWSC